ncbi:zinc finger CCCH domain-containing protein 62-like [Dorcoceras hygrometricum]|uniref:Zinc finger CCCH domain-containing protein 62-like n=1 Tax=Dorcoceras hygrometricum TaxID=472368 RepID=A0A2Z7CKQ5_9LAMI|nr:zinc finger CCCH domain-containing protein 62-like [Dorcoceras hygrometricum]
MRSFCHRLKDGNGEALYPRSSFTINCTGDVCKGDVVLFNQRVYESFNKMKRHGTRLGRRTVAGRIVKESYGAAKQQHTFTVEVLWSKGTKKLAPLSPLLVKGRNLYKMKTYRQQWKNERERLTVLAEKHMRGAAARSMKAVRRTKMETETNKSLARRGNKRHRPFQKLHSSGTEETDHVNKNRVHDLRKTLSRNKKHDPHQYITSFQELNSKQTRDFRRPTSHSKHPNLKQSNQARKPFFHQTINHCQDPYTFNPSTAQRRPQHFGVNPLHGSLLTPFSESQEFNPWNLMCNGDPYFTQESRQLYQALGKKSVRSPPFYSSSVEMNRWR